jgi:hypothetical protein
LQARLHPHFLRHKSRLKLLLKKHDIQDFDIGNIVSLKILREGRTSTDNKRLFVRILDEPYSHPYQVFTSSGVIARPVATKALEVFVHPIWPIFYSTSDSVDNTRPASHNVKACLTLGESELVRATYKYRHFINYSYLFR